MPFQAVLTVLTRVHMCKAVTDMIAKHRNDAATKADARRGCSCRQRRRRQGRQAPHPRPRHVAPVLRRRRRKGCRVRQRGRAAAAVPVARPAAAGAGRRRRPSPPAHAVRGRPQRSRGAQPKFPLTLILLLQDAQAGWWQSQAGCKARETKSTPCLLFGRSSMVLSIACRSAGSCRA